MPALRKEAPSSMASSRPPTGAPNATDTPATKGFKESFTFPKTLKVHLECGRDRVLCGKAA